MDINAGKKMRIISLVPSITELLNDLGLDEQVVGITKFCERPAHWRAEKRIVGGTKTVDIQRVMDLQPDLVLANREENVREQVEAIGVFSQVWTSEVRTVQNALDLITQVGHLTHTEAKAAALRARIAADYAQPLPRRGRAAYLIWRKPYMVAGGDTFIHSMMDWAGFTNVFGDQLRYPSVAPDQLAATDPDVLLLSSEPFPFAEKHIAALQELCPRARVLLADGAIFSWYGSRMLEAKDYFLRLMK
jgi:ABC-type Fe3+-hydroxamate transport system substrate-binding protein